MANCVIARRVGFEKCPIPCKELKKKVQIHILTRRIHVIRRGHFVSISYMSRTALVSKFKFIIILNNYAPPLLNLPFAHKILIVIFTRNHKLGK